jgi:hypothetical protein
MLFVKYMLTSVIAGVIILHTVIAHEHSPRSNQVAELSAPLCKVILFDSVKHTFGIDHGDGHLEQFVKVNLETPSPLILTTVIFVSAYKESITNQVNSLVALAVLKLADQRRGPPTLIV